MTKLIDLTGQRFGRLTVIERGPDKERPRRERAGEVRWLCICDCGNETLGYGHALRVGEKLSCGCWRQVMFDATKICGRCRKELPHSEFYKTGRANARVNSERNELTPYCRRCTRIVRMDQYSKNPESYNHRTHLWNYALKLEVLDHYSGARCHCRCCGETEPRMLAIDHINGGGHKHRSSLGKGKTFAGVKFYKWLKDQGYPSGYQVLCHNCNWMKHLNKGHCTHAEDRLVGALSFGA